MAGLCPLSKHWAGQAPSGPGRGRSTGTSLQQQLAVLPLGILLEGQAGPTLSERHVSIICRGKGRLCSSGGAQISGFHKPPPLRGTLGDEHGVANVSFLLLVIMLPLYHHSRLSAPPGVPLAKSGGLSKTECTASRDPRHLPIASGPLPPLCSLRGSCSFPALHRPFPRFLPWSHLIPPRLEPPSLGSSRPRQRRGGLLPPPGAPVRTAFTLLSEWISTNACGQACLFHSPLHPSS